MILFFLIIMVVYLPVLCFNYPFHDDLSNWVKVKEYGWKNVMFDSDMFVCRYGLAIIRNFQSLFVHKVFDLTILRFIGIAISSCSANLILNQLRRLSFPDIQAFLIISALFFLPGFADILFYGIYSPSIALCIFLCCWSFQRLESHKDIFIPALTFLLAITIYPPGAMFYWALVGMWILFAGDKLSVKKDMLRAIAVGLMVILTYAISIFFMHYFFRQKTTGYLHNPYVISHDWPGKFHWFLQEPLQNALNLWNIFPKTAVSIAVSGFIAATVLIEIKKFSLSRFCLFVFVFLLSFLPNLAAQGNAAFYRCLIPMTSLIWFVLVWAVFEWSKIIPRILPQRGITVLLSFIVIFAGITTFHNVLYYRVMPSFIEWRAYKSMAQESRAKKIDAIHIVIPYHHLSMERYDEFGILSSNYVSDLYPMICCAFNESGLPARPLPSIYFSYPDDKMLIELNAIFIKKLPDGTWIGRDINKDPQFHQLGAFSGDSLNHKLFYNTSPQPVLTKRKNWYVLNLNDFFGSSDDKSFYPDLAQAYYNRGNIYFMHGNYVQAISDFSKAIELKPDDADAYYNLGLAFFKRGNLNEALSDFSKAIALNPKDVQAYNDRAIIYYQLKKYDNASKNVR